MVCLGGVSGVCNVCLYHDIYTDDGEVATGVTGVVMVLHHSVYPCTCVVVTVHSLSMPSILVDGVMCRS